MKKLIKKRSIAKKKVAVKKIAKRLLLGRVTHYYDKIKVAVIKLNAPLKNGDSIEIEGGEKSFFQKVSSMEKDHEKIAKAKKGNEVGMKVKNKVREGYRVFKG